MTRIDADGYEVHYEVHWARANAADKVVALRAAPIRHATREDAQCEAVAISPPWPGAVTIVCEVRRG